MDLEETKDMFRNLVRKMRILPISDDYTNSYPWQSRIVIEELFAYAEDRRSEIDEIKMFTGDIDGRFFDNILCKKMRDFAREGYNFNIILAKPPKKQNILGWQQLAAEHPGQITINMKPEYDKGLCHFTIVDDAYRIELAHDEYGEEQPVTEEIPKRPARFGFHQPKFTESLLSYWNERINTGDLIPIEEEEAA